MRTIEKSDKWMKAKITAIEQKQLQQYCKEHNITQSELIRMAVWARINADEKK